MKAVSLRFFLLVLMASLLLVFSSSSVMASGITITEKGTKGLGNAWAGGAAVAEDASTIYWNPAGLTRLDKNRVEFSVHLIRPSFEFDNKGSTTVIPPPSPFNTLSGGDGGDAGGVHFVPNFFYSHDISEKWKAGVGITSPFGLATDYHSSWVGRYHTTESAVLTVDINPTTAYRINSQWSVGGGISAQYIDADLQNAIDYGTAGAGFPLFLTPQGVDGSVKLTGDDWSFGFNLGVLFELNEETRFGLAYRSKISHELDGEADFSTPAAVQPLATFLGLVNTDVSADIDLPANIALSGYHQLNDSQHHFLKKATGSRRSKLSGDDVRETPDHIDHT